MDIFETYGIENQHDAMELTEQRTILVVYNQMEIDIKYQFLQSTEPNAATFCFIHGWGANASIWIFVALQLKDFANSILIDLPGHGKNQEIGDNDELISFEFTERLIHELLQDFPDIILIGHSMGGAIVQNFVLNNPNKVKATILVGTALSFRSFLPPTLMELIVPTSMGMGGNIIRSIAEFLSPKLIKENDLDKKRRFACGMLLFNDLLEVGDELIVKEYRNLIHPWDATKIEPFEVPTLIVVGESDMLTPMAQSVKMNMFYPNSLLKIIEDGQHNLPLFNYFQLSKTIRFFLEYIIAQ